VKRLRDVEAVSPAMLATLGVALVVLFVPLLVIVLLSFNTSPYGTLPFHFTTQWYQALFSESDLLGPTWLSLQLSFAIAVTAAIFGTMAAMWLNRRTNPLVTVAFRSILVSAITVPWLILGLAMLLVLNAIGLGRSLFSIYLGLLGTTLPYVIFIVAARLHAMERDLEDAARSLGAGPVATFLWITAPIILPAIVSGMLISFIVSFNNFLIQYFLAPFGVETLPLKIYTLIRVGYLPDLNALATLIVAATFLLILLLHRLGLHQTVLPAGRTK
jgi:ABC-type spermidine/putrescine transport system permease subunit II